MASQLDLGNLVVHFVPDDTELQKAFDRTEQRMYRDPTREADIKAGEQLSLKYQQKVIDMYLEGQKAVEQYGQSSLATFRAIRSSYLDLIRTFAIVGLAVKGIGMLTSSFIALRDKGIGPAIDAFVEGIPLIGPGLNKIGDDIAELIMNTNETTAAMKRLASFVDKEDKILQDIFVERRKRQKEIESFSVSPAERERYVIQERYNEQLEKATSIEQRAMHTRRRAMADWFTDARRSEYEMMLSANLFDEAERIRTEAMTARNLEMIGSAMRLTQHLETQLATMRMSAGEAEAYRMRLGKLVDEKTIENIRRLHNEIDKVQDAMQRETAIEDFTKRLRRMTETFGMGEIQLLRWERAQLGLQDAQSEYQIGLLEWQQNRKEQQEAAAQAFKDEQRELDNLAKTINEMVKTPLDKYFDIEKQVRQAVELNKITEEQADIYLKIQKGRLFETEMREAGAMRWISPRFISPSSLAIGGASTVPQTLQESLGESRRQTLLLSDIRQHVMDTESLN